MVTHDPLDALLLADRVVVLSDGRVVEEGTSSEVLSRPRSPFAARLAGLGVSGQQHGLVVLDEQQRPLRAAKLWCDTSTAAEAREYGIIDEVISARSLADTTGPITRAS